MLPQCVRTVFPLHMKRVSGFDCVYGRYVTFLYLTDVTLFIFVESQFLLLSVDTLIHEFSCQRKMLIYIAIYGVRKVKIRNTISKIGNNYCKNTI